MNPIRTLSALMIVAAVADVGCSAPGVSFESAFPTVVCEAGGQRRVRVYGHGYKEGVAIQATFGGAAAGVERVDEFTLDVYLPDISLTAEAFPWDPHDFNTGQHGMYAYVDGNLEAVPWNVLIPRSQLTSSGSPDFKDLDGNDIIFRRIEVEAIVLGYEEVVDEESGETTTEPIVVDGPFTFGYFSTDRPWIDAEGNSLGACDDGRDDSVGEFCYEPLYFTEGGQPLLYDASDYAYWVMSEATGDPYLYASWDPYLYKGAYYTELDGEYQLFYYDGRGNETDYAPGDLFNQSFGIFFTLEPVYVYQDVDGAITTYDAPLASPGVLSYIGMEASAVDHEFFPSILPITHSVDLQFTVGSSGEAHTLGSPLGVISKDFDYSLWYTYTPFYDFTEYKSVDLDGDGSDDDVIPVDGSWGCVWLDQ